MSNRRSLRCILPWKALFMDERDGRLSALPCCANWINRSYGPIEEDSSLDVLWNGNGAQEIRRLMAQGRQDELCATDCPWLVSGRFAEDALQVLPGPPGFEENQRLNNREIWERCTVLKSRPMALRLIPTLRCNIRCRMCHQDHRANLHLPERFMADVRSIGQYLYDYQLHGGEVLISQRLSEWAEPIWLNANPQLLLSLITNATKLPKRAWEILRAARINYITVSINAATRETYRYMAEADLFDKVISNTMRLRDLGRTHALRKFEVYLSFVIMRCNYHEVPAFIELANWLGLPVRLILVVGDRLGESIYTDLPTLQGTLDAIVAAELLALDVSRHEVVRVRQAVERSIRSRQGHPEAS